RGRRAAVKGRITLALVAVCGALAAVPSASVAVPRDRDRDGLTNRFEKLRSHTSPSRADTDRDGLKDGLEVRRTHTNPRKKDTDADGVTDGLEVMLGTNPRRKQKPPRDTTPPETYMMDAPVGTVPSSSASFSFISSETNSSFQCRLDTGSWGACTSPKAYAGLADGAHTFAVRATDQ